MFWLRPYVRPTALLSYDADKKELRCDDEAIVTGFCSGAFGLPTMYYYLMYDSPARKIFEVLF